MLLNFCNTISSSTILVIDDELPVLNMLKLILTRNGFMVDTAENGEEGIKKIESKNYALILTDIKMPGISGDQVLDYLRNKIKRLTPVIGMSGTPWLLDQSDYDAVLPKPCSMKETLVLINQLITESS
ncbi:MAG: response regulator [Desulfobacteraceae bacterium]|nr:response regulator [Desulfobacteraceae bacterium]